MIGYLGDIVGRAPEGNPGHWKRSVVGSLLEDKLADCPQAVDIAVGYNSEHSQEGLVRVVSLRLAG